MLQTCGDLTQSSEKQEFAFNFAGRALGHL